MKRPAPRLCRQGGAADPRGPLSGRGDLPEKRPLLEGVCDTLEAGRAWAQRHNRQEPKRERPARSRIRLLSMMRISSIGRRHCSQLRLCRLALSRYASFAENPPLSSLAIRRGSRRSKSNDESIVSSLPLVRSDFGRRRDPARRSPRRLPGIHAAGGSGSRRNCQSCICSTRPGRHVAKL